MSYRTASKPILKHRGRNRKERPKTFKSEESAKRWADTNKIKSYEILNLKPASETKKKLRVVIR